MTTLRRLDPGKAVVLCSMALCLAAMVVSSAVYRTTNPSLVKEVEQSGADHGQDVMAMIGQLMQRLQENPQDPDILESLAMAFSRLQAWDRAGQFWKRLLAVEPGNTQARQQLAMTLYRQQDFQGAAGQLQAVLKQDPDDAYAHFNLAILFARHLEAPGRAREHLQAVIDAPGAPEELREEARTRLEELGSS
jgi:Tfp pilus assembly protein PilF